MFKKDIMLGKNNFTAGHSSARIFFVHLRGDNILQEMEPYLLTEDLVFKPALAPSGPLAPASPSMPGSP